MRVKRCAAGLLLLLLCGCAASPAAPTLQVSDETIYMALTFDDGPSPSCTPRLLDGLRQRGVHATFFLIGSQIPGQEALLRRIQSEGHQIGNHSYSHADLSQLSTAEALADLARCDELLQQTLGPGCYWIRPPYGFLTPEELGSLQAPAVYWAVDTEDWKSRDPDSVLDIVLRQAEDGDILLLHDCYDSSVTAALRIIDRLRQRGVQFVTLEELFALKNVAPRCGVLYRRPA